MYVGAEYFVFESFVLIFVKSFEDVTKYYVCGVCVLLGVGYGFMEDGESSVRPLTSLNPCWLSLWRSCSVTWWLRRLLRILSRILPWISRREMDL